MPDFDPERFKHGQFDIGEGLSTEIIPPDEGVYNAKISNWNLVGGTSQVREDGSGGNDWLRLDITYELEDPDGSQKEKTGRDPVTARQGLFLDLTDSGDLDFNQGRNVRLGQLLEACELNSGTFAFNMLDGKPVKVLVRHRTTDNGRMAEVNRVAHPRADVR